MTYTKYKHTNHVGPQHNIKIPNVQSNRNQIQNISSQVDSQRGRPSPRIAWGYPSSPIYAPNIEKLKVYLKVNIFSLTIISMNLPYVILIFCINYWKLQCDDLGSVLLMFMLLQLIFFILYPYFVKEKLAKFSSNQIHNC